MARPTHKSTESGKKHAFKSFKERVDTLKIEPSKKLNTRAYDYVETSHFLVTLQHWKEVNLSEDFTDLLFEIESLSQTLPQIIHHQEKIFASLLSHIKKNDINSIQPLLELVTQFIHDLGPDFMPYYITYLKMILDLTQKLNPNDSQNMKNTANVLEWAFNSLAFAFKYLARHLVTDLKPTFMEIFPILILTKNTFVSRFCAEAFSFLIKKSKQDVLQNIIDYSLYEQRTELETNHSYRESLAILFSESMKNTAETFHSKASLVLTVLVFSALDSAKGGDAQINTVCDTLLQILQHGTMDSCEKFFILCMNIFEDVIKVTESHDCLRSILILLITMSFSDSGNKISNWLRLLDVVKKVLSRAEYLLESVETLPFSLLATTAHLFTVIVRNSDLQILSKSFHFMADYLSSRSDCRYFLSFYELSIMTSGDKLIAFGINKYLQTVITQINCEEDMLSVARFMIKIEGRSGYDFSNIIIPAQVSKHLFELIESETETLEDSNLINLYWKLRLASYVPSNALESQLLLNVLEKMNSSHLTNSILLSGLRGVTLNLAVSVMRQFDELPTILQIVKNTVEKSKQSIEYIASLKTLVDAWPEINNKCIESDFNFLSTQLASNLSAPNKRLRCGTIDCLASIYKCVQKPFPSFLMNIRLVDQVPLEVGNANDIKLRIRVLFDEFVKSRHVRYEEKLMFINFIIGILSNNFRPCWLVVYECLPNLANSGCSDLLWDVLVKYLVMNYREQIVSCPGQQPMSIDSTDSEENHFKTSDDRLNSNIKVASSTIFEFASEYEASVFNTIQENSDLEYKTNMRTRVISALQAAHFVAQSHGSQLIEIVSDLYKFSEDESDVSIDWSAKDRLQLLTTFANFKNLKKLEGNDILFTLVLENLSSKLPEVQKESLNLVFAWKIVEINKYKDDLKNLLDDKLFRDELQSLVSKDSDSMIEDSDRIHVMPIVLRILYGRAKGLTNNNSKNSRKFAIASVLPNLPDDHILQFLSITTEKIAYSDFFDSKKLNLATYRDIHNMQGYLNLLFEVYNGLGYKYANLLKETVKPLVFTLISAQQVIDECSDNDLLLKQAKNLRQTGLKCLDHLFKITSGSYDWREESDLIFSAVVKPRLGNFAQENLQQPSALLQVMLGWIGSTSLLPFLYYDNFAPVAALMGLLSHPHTKNSVRSEILDFCISAFTKKVINDENFVTVLAMIVDCLLVLLPSLIQDSEEREINSRSATLLLLVIEGNFVSDQVFMKKLVNSCAAALDKPPTQITANDKISILLSLIPIINQFECFFEDIQGLYECTAKALRTYIDRDVRECLVKIFGAIGSKFSEYAQIGELLANLNSYSATRLSEPDFERRLQAFRVINEDIYNDLTARQWTPVLYCCLYFMNDPDELVIRSNAAFTIMRFIDSLIGDSSLDTDDGSFLLNSVVLPQLRKGLKRDSEAVRDGYIRVLSHLVKNYDLTDEFTSMKILLSDDDDLDFFKNFTHIQLSCRLDAIKQLKEVKSHLSSNAIYYYILPMTEAYTTCREERYRDLLNETLVLWSFLVRSLKWEHFRQLFRKKTAAVLKASPHELKDAVHCSVTLSRGLIESIKASKKDNGNKDESFNGLPEDTIKLDKQIMEEFYNPVLKVLKIRDDSTIGARTGLLEAAINCLLCVSNTIAEPSISGTLTSTCQALRSKSQSIRDAVRTSLSKVSSILGPKYFKFVVKELRSALTRGSQIHVLSYTLHTVMEAARETFTCGDLDESVSLIVSVIMEDIFGAAGSEKDAEGYTSQMKEVKARTSYETGQILSSLITLPHFHYLIEPIKLLLRENLPLKTKKKLDELIQSYSTGLHKNPNSSKIDILILCYELYSQSLNDFKSVDSKDRKKADDHFLVNLSSKTVENNLDRSQALYTIQRLSFTLLRSALTKHESLQTVPNLDGFLPNIEASLHSEDEQLLVSIYRVLDIIAKLQFPQSKDSFFEKTASRAFEIIQNMPSTSNELCQVCLRYVATIVAYRGTVEISDTAIIYLLVKIMPDLEDPEKQSRAFNFLKAIISKHVMLPEVYDVMEKVSTIMIVNHNKTIRDTSRNLYFKFLMEYEHSSSKLDKSFKFLVNNLEYPTQSGRQSVLELIHSIISSSPPSLLEQLCTSFFVGLANVVVSDDSSTCREMASILITEIFNKVSEDKLAPMENFCYSWITQDTNTLLRRCGLIVYKLYATSRGFGSNFKLDSAAYNTILNIISSAKNGCKDEEADWELIYTAMNVFASMCEYHGTEIFSKVHEVMWMNLTETLLYPHSWVRYLSTRLIGTLLGNLDNISFEISDQQIQTIAYRLVRQLKAPGVSQKLGQQVVKNLIKIVSRWELQGTAFCNTAELEDSLPDDEVRAYKSATDFILSKTCFLMRQNIAENDYVAKLAAIQLGAMISQIASPERLTVLAKQLIRGLFVILESKPNTEEKREVQTMAKECLKIMEERLGVSKFGEIHNSVRKEVAERRLERRAHRAQLAINAPEIAANQRMSRKEKFRSKRKRDRDEKGPHKSKRKRTSS